jgi:hypothetical protein
VNIWGFIGTVWTADRVREAPLQLDEEQHIDASEHYRVDVEEVAREGAGGLAPQEL